MLDFGTGEIRLATMMMRWPPLIVGTHRIPGFSAIPDISPSFPRKRESIGVNAMLDFGTTARKQQANFRHKSSTISLDSRAQRRDHGHLLAKGRQSDNLHHYQTFPAFPIFP